jgi:signal transduction histidine kinase/ActR/RegA family two-component response regulator
MGSCIPVTGGLLRGPGSATFWAGSVTLVILGTFLARSLLGPETFPSPGAYSIETSFVGALLMAVALCGTVAGHAASWRALREEADEAAERQLHAEKQRKALGREFDRLRLLAGGVAHDFNNLLQTIGGNAELARDELPEDSPARLPLGELELATERAAALVRELLAFAGHGSPHIAPLELGEVAAEAVGLARPLVAEEIRIEFLHPVTEIWTRADRDQTLGALLNLIKNAGDAQSGGGRIEVSTGVGKLGTSGLEEQLGAPDPEASEFGYIEVQDAGGGIPDEVRTRMFDPFYTPRRGGRGLGLPAVLALAENLRGALEFGSRGDGTAFRILLPHTRVPDPGETQRPIPTLSLEDRLVLVVDDDERVRRVVRRMLENLGARVIDAESGFDALHRFRDEVMQIDAALIDLAMPEIDGEELLYALRDVRGDLPILIITGQASGGYEHLAELPEVEYLQKPFTAASMTRAIEILLAPENDDDVFR